MKGGDLSNESAPGMGVRFEKVIKTEEGKLNKSLKGYLQYVTRSVDVNIFVITTNDRRRALAFLTKWGVPYNEVIEADSSLEIPDIVRENNLLTYFDLDKELLSNIKARGNEKVRAELWTSQMLL